MEERPRGAPRATPPDIDDDGDVTDAEREHSERLHNITRMHGIKMRMRSLQERRRPARARSDARELRFG